MSAPKNYRSFAEFQREEIRPEQKLGWSIDDLWKEAELRVSELHFEDRDLEELDFGA
ncbi:MAG TPA: transcriptional regulator [Polyangiaceae bacterium]|nr:transcriptional regulator [Polyangiaceae bacterium]